MTSFQRVDIMDPSVKEKTITTKTATFWVQGGIIRLRIHDPQKQTLDVVKANVDAILEVSGDSVLPLITTVVLKGITKEAKDYLKRQVSENLVSAAGLIATGNVSYFFAQMFFHLVKHLVPIKVFKTEEAAEEWIHSLDLPEKKRSETKFSNL